MDYISHDSAKLSPDIRLDAILLDGTQFSLSLQSLEYWKGLYNNAQLCVKSQFYYRAKKREHSCSWLPTHHRASKSKPDVNLSPNKSPFVTENSHTHTDEIKASLVSIHVVLAVLSNYRIFLSGKKIKLLKKNKRMSLEILVVLPLERSWFRHFLRALKGKVLPRFKKSQIL